MRSSVEAAFVPYNSELEGVVPWMYLDILGLVTVAIGNLIDPEQYVRGLPFVNRDGSPADPDLVVAQWKVIKATESLAQAGHRAAERLTTVRLTPAGIHSIVMAKARANEKILTQRWPDFADWPADAQLALHSWAWACGPGGKWPKFDKALKSRDFATAAVEGWMNEDGPDRIPNTKDDNWGLKPRNRNQKQMWLNAVQVQSEGGMFDPDELRFKVKNAEMVVMPDTHAAPKQTAVLPEEVTGSGGIIHPGYYDKDWVRALNW